VRGWSEGCQAVTARDWPDAQQFSDAFVDHVSVDSSSQSQAVASSSPSTLHIAHPRPANHAPHPPPHPTPITPHHFAVVAYYVMSLLSSNVVNYLGTFPHRRPAPCAVARTDYSARSLAISSGGRLRQCSAAAVEMLDTRPRDAALREERRGPHAHQDPAGWHVFRRAAGGGHKCASTQIEAGTRVDRCRLIRDTDSATTTGSPTRRATAPS
jgi:hypothetical protein